MAKKEIITPEQEKIKKEVQAFIDEYNGLVKRHGYGLVAVLRSNNSSLTAQLDITKIEKKSSIETL